MIQHFKSLVFTDTGRDTSIVFVGSFLNVVAGGLFFILVPRILGPANYGLFSVVIATEVLAVRLTSLGIETGILRFASLQSKNANAILTIALKTYLLLGLLVALIGLFITQSLANFLGYPQISQLLQIAFLATVFFHLTNFFVAALQARSEFLKASIPLIANNLTRLFLLAIGAYLFTLGLYFVTLIYFAVTIVSTLIGKYFLRFKIEKTVKGLLADFFKFNVWVYLALIVSSIPFDNYFLLKLAGPTQTGFYAAPLKVLTFSYEFGGNFTRVLASRFASFDTAAKAKSFAIKAFIFPILFIFSLIILIAISRPLIELLFGLKYLEAVQVLRILSLGFIFFFASTIPSSIILYYFGKSNISFIITAARYSLMVVLLGFLVPSQKAIGAAWAFTASELLSFFLITTYVIFKFQRS